MLYAVIIRLSMEDVANTALLSPVAPARRGLLHQQALCSCSPIQLPEQKSAGDALPLSLQSVWALSLPSVKG